MSSPRAALLVLLFAGVVAGVACGNDPPPETPKSMVPDDKTEVKVEKVGVNDAPPPPSAPSGVVNAPPPPPSEPAPPPADPSDDPNIGGPQEPAVEKAIAPIRPKLRACYKKALEGQPGMNGSATFDTTIGKSGKVSAARFVRKEGLSDDMVSCLTTAVKTMVFEKDRKSQVVALTFGNVGNAGNAGGGASGTSDAGAKKH